MPLGEAVWADVWCKNISAASPIGLDRFRRPRQKRRKSKNLKNLENLSGGQRQKLAVARAFLKDAKLLILDEATAALDNKSQARIQSQLNHRLKGRTTVISVVHRLDIVKNYDKVAVMKAGKIIEMGTYEELIDRKGVLYELVYGKK